MALRRPLGLILAAAILVVVIWAVLGRPSSDERYVDRVSRLCHDTDEALKGRSGTYFDSVVFISNRKLEGLSKIEPPGDRTALHRQLLASEGRLARDAQAATALPREGAIATFPSLRRRQAALEARYRSLGIRSCSD